MFAPYTVNSIVAQENLIVNHMLTAKQNEKNDLVFSHELMAAFIIPWHTLEHTPHTPWKKLRN